MGKAQYMDSTIMKNNEINAYLSENSLAGDANLSTPPLPKFSRNFQLRNNLCHSWVPQDALSVRAFLPQCSMLTIFLPQRGRLSSFSFIESTFWGIYYTLDNDLSKSYHALSSGIGADVSSFQT